MNLQCLHPPGATTRPIPPRVISDGEAKLSHNKRYRDETSDDPIPYNKRLKFEGRTQVLPLSIPSPSEPPDGSPRLHPLKYNRKEQLSSRKQLIPSGNPYSYSVFWESLHGSAGKRIQHYSKLEDANGRVAELLASHKSHHGPDPVPIDEGAGDAWKISCERCVPHIIGVQDENGVDCRHCK
jgi:hypothetical protein